MPNYNSKKIELSYSINIMIYNIYHMIKNEYENLFIKNMLCIQ